MSDDEYEYHYSDASDEEQMDDGDGDGDGSDDGFEYTDEEESQEGDDAEVALEDSYYNAKGLRDSDVDEAIHTFESVVEMEKEKLEGKIGLWSFKALKQMVKLRMKCGEFAEAQNAYNRLLTCISDPACQGISPNAMEKGINGMLDRVTVLFQSGSGSNNPTQAESNSSKAGPQDLARLVYDSTLSLFHPQRGTRPNERLWFKTNLKYGQLLYESSETRKLQSVIQDLLQTSSNGQGNNSSSETMARSSTSSTHLMEIYALQIQLYSRLKDNKKLREIYDRAMHVQGGIPHPRTVALIQELGGKMHMASREYEQANTAFFQAFKSYDEAGDFARLRCLKYLVLASMLHASSINPFDSQEVRPYKNDPQIVAMTNLVDAFHSNDIQNFERILNRNEGKVMDDEFIREYISDLLRTIRTQVLLQVVVPYTRISLTALSRQLNGIDIKEIESLLVPLILDGKLDGRIDQVKGILIKNMNVSSSKGHGGGGGDASESIGMDQSGKGVQKQGTIPEWGASTIPVRKIDAIETLISEMEKLTNDLVAASIPIGPSQLQRKSEVLSR